MPKWEKAACTWLEQHLLLIFLVLATLCAFLARCCMRGFISGDASTFLLPWYEQIKAGGGFAALKAQVGDYNIFYQFWIALFTYLPLAPLTAYKAFSCGFDFLLAAAAGWYVWRQSSALRGALTYAALLFTPVVFLNSACWAQCDAIYTFFVVAALLCLGYEHPLPAFILLGIAFSFKLQAMFILPVFLFVYFYKKRYSIFYFAIVPAMMLITSLPALLLGRPVSDVFGIYVAQSKAVQAMYWGYPSFWSLFCRDDYDQYEVLGTAAILLTFVLLLACMAALDRCKTALNRKTLLILAFWFSYTCVLFLPNMHERYDYLPCILAVILAFLAPRTALPALVLNGISLMGYVRFLFHVPSEVQLLAFVNLAVYAVYAVLLVQELQRQTQLAAQAPQAPSAPEPVSSAKT
ncbi:MAG: glycosyltransferase 87 family protein [Faecalibacterium sp.]|nr:glycosyltransferase 87 family protein [Faecalibacterium sp.]